MSGVPRPLPLAIDFFCLFSRFEYALKSAGYLLQDRGGDGAKPDWKRFSDEADKLGLFERLHNDPDVNYLIDNPPKRQVVQDRRLTWEHEPQCIDCMGALIKAVKCVRNNLFHGGKTRYGAGYRSERDRALLRGAIAVLRALLDARSDIRGAFVGWH